MDGQDQKTATNNSPDEELAWLQLGCANLSPHNLMKLLRAFGSASAVVNACKCGALEAGKFKKRVDQSEPIVEQALKWAQSSNHHLVVRSNPDYPYLLAQIADPPAVLFVAGNSEVLSQPQLAIVGARQATPPARHITRNWSYELACEELVITSGLAYGIDAEAHHGCLQAGGRSIAVIASGPDICYPSKHKDLSSKIAETGAIVTEFPPGVAPIPRHFPQRNRLISGLAQATLVIEAGVRSGSLVTARHAIEQNRDVFCMPGSVLNPLAAGCHQLIRDGAQLVQQSSDIAVELCLQSTLKKDATSNTHAEKGNTTRQKSPDAFVQHLGFEPFTLDELCKTLECDVTTLVSRLQELELDGTVVSLGDGRYQRCQ